MKLNFQRRFTATMLAVVTHFKIAQYVDFYQWAPSCLLMTLVMAFRCFKALDHRTLQNKNPQKVLSAQATAVFSMVTLQATVCCGILEVFSSQLMSYTDGEMSWPVLIILALKLAYWSAIYQKFSNIDEWLLVLLPLCS